MSDKAAPAGVGEPAPHPQKELMHYRIPHTYTSACGAQPLPDGIHWTTDVAFVTCPQCVAAPSAGGQPAPSPRLELGTLLDLLDMAATCIGDGRAAATATLGCIYRDAIREALERLRAAAVPASPPEKS